MQRKLATELPCRELLDALPAAIYTTQLPGRRVPVRVTSRRTAAPITATFPSASFREQNPPTNVSLWHKTDEVALGRRCLL
jgi:hypothetical protein